MKHENHFKVLLQNTVNLSTYSLEQLDSRTAAIYAALKADPALGPYVAEMIPQGSWAQKTIIKPVQGREFDADFLLRLQENPDWSQSPKGYIDQTHYALDRHSTYGAMPHYRKCRCVRVVYANFCHVDIVPYLLLEEGRQVIVNRDEDKWEATNPGLFCCFRGWGSAALVGDIPSGS
ncbi:MAG: SMODS domain-containing nucleotidyltransferase [Pseudonocardiaceae bacterium]